MSASVWFEEVDVALRQEILNTVKVKDPTTNEIKVLDPKSAIVRKPEEDFKIETFPCVSIYNLNYRHDPMRYNPNPVIVSRDYDNGTAELEDPAIPFNLTYQIDFWSSYQSDMNLMTRTWLMKHHRQFNLEVVDSGGTPRNCNVIIQGSPVKSDLMDKGERKFHTIITYHIWVELDEETRYNVNMVTSREVNVNQD